MCRQTLPLILLILLSAAAFGGREEYNQQQDAKCKARNPALMYEWKAGHCVQEHCPAGAGRLYSGGCSCWVPEWGGEPKVTCSKDGLVTHCLPKGAKCEHYKTGFDPVTGKCTDGKDPGEQGCPVSEIPESEREADWKEVKEKCSNPKKMADGQHSTLSTKEFLLYLKKLEEANPSFDRKKLIAKIHAVSYGADVDATHFGIKLFHQGPETDGYDKVDSVCKLGKQEYAPKWVTHGDKKIDISHAYAGIRSDLNRRNTPWRWFLRRLNTHTGDTLQNYLFHPWNHFVKGLDYAPPDQRAGNDAGIWIAKWYLKEGNENKPLSEAFQAYFDSLK